MKKSIISVLILILGFKSVSAQTNLNDTIVHNSLNRTYLLHIPASYNAANPTPLVIGLHGGGALSWYSLEQVSQLISKSNSSGFLLVYPEGFKYLGIRTWNGGGCCGDAVLNNIDDVGFISNLIDTLESQYNIDTTRIYATGISNGAIMAYRLACELSHRIAAIAPVAGTLEDTLYTCNPSRPVPIIQFHSVLDSNIYMQGGVGQGASGYRFNPINYGLQKFSAYNNCTQDSDSSYYIVGSTFYYKKRWHGCNCNAEEILYLTGDGGHSWPGGQQGTYVGADSPSSIINANDSIWNFFQQHTLDCNPNSLNDLQNHIPQIKIYPNPAFQFVTLEFDNAIKDNCTLTLYNTQGQLVQTIMDITTNKVEIQIKNLVSGLYFLHLRTDRQLIATGKLTIE
jgi:polyhydroxybutyrate depolymerase